MEIFYWIIPYFLTAVFLIPFCLSVIYFLLGIQNLVTGRREKSTIKVRSGYKAIFLSLIVMTLVFFAWYYYGGRTILSL
jgi:uncharacterized membrane protein